MSILRKNIKRFLHRYNIDIIQFATASELKNHRRAVADLDLLVSLPESVAYQALRYLRRSHAQLRQDLFVLSQLNFKANGFYVEFGATDGVYLSNTLLLERDFQWSGILAEPGRCWHSRLRRNRRAAIETDCVWSESNTRLTFKEAAIPELSVLDGFDAARSQGEDIVHGATYDVNTISLNDLLSKHGAPEQIDYLSIDTEGSEYEILSAFDFSKHSIKVITCEHNFTDMRQKIYDLLSARGYIRVYPELSDFDDWYVLSSEH